MDQVQPAQSAQNTLSKKDLVDWQKNLKNFFIPLALLYLTYILAVLQVPHHVFNLSDFVPNNTLDGAIALYVVNALYDLFNKWKAGA